MKAKKWAPAAGQGRRLYCVLEDFLPMTPIWPYVAVCPQLEVLMLDGVEFDHPDKLITMDTLKEVWLRPHSSYSWASGEGRDNFIATVQYLHGQACGPTVYVDYRDTFGEKLVLDGVVWVTDDNRGTFDQIALTNKLQSTKPNGSTESFKSWAHFHEGIHFNEHLNLRRPAFDFLRWLMVEMWTDIIDMVHVH